MLTKTFRAALMAAAMAGLVSAAGLAASPAQEKKAPDPKAKEAQPPAKGTKTADEPLGEVLVYQGKDGWRWKVTNAEGKALAIGTTGLDTKEDALKVVEMVKTTLTKQKAKVDETKPVEKK